MNSFEISTQLETIKLNAEYIIRSIDSINEIRRKIEAARGNGGIYSMIEKQIRRTIIPIMEETKLLFQDDTS